VSAPVRRTLIFTFLRLARGIRVALISSRGLQRVLLRPRLEGLLWLIGKWRVWFAFEDARRSVPAYRELVGEHPGTDVKPRGLDPDLTALPITTKANYVRRFSVEQRCRGGHLPERGAVIDESSGTSGVPNNWVRGPEERADVQKLLQVAVRSALGEGPLFVINAFALGPWATGMNVTMSVVDIAVVKSVGPDVQKIENTLELFGPRYRYLICGYPPFLKRLVDSAGVDWEHYSCVAVVGGEGMSEALRSHLGRYFVRVYSSYGASDLEINLAGETDFSVALRQLLAKRPELGGELSLPELGTLPMVFQFNPLDYHIESSDEGELVISICRLKTASPKLRYDVGDLGRAVRYGGVVRALRALGMEPNELAAEHLPLPCMFVYGRADTTVAFYGCKVTPGDLEEVVYSLPELAALVDSFALVVDEDEQANALLTFAFELAPGAEPPNAGRSQALRDAALARLAKINQDYREASRMVPAGREPALEFHRAGTGPFAGYDVRLKRRYVQKR
jgi:phenylacetate-CoA ligase